jgi:ankyrin repeat protein
MAAVHSLAPLAGRLIAGGAEVVAGRPGDGYTPLCIACRHGNVVMVERLIAAGSRVDDNSSCGFTPLHLAAERNRLDVVKLLIAVGADVNKACVSGCTLLHTATEDGHAGVVSVLIETAVVDLNAALTDGELADITPLFLAAQNNRLDVLKLLIAAGADVNVACDDGSTPLHAAAENGHAGVVSALIATAGVDLNAALTGDDSAGVTPLYLAARGNRLDVVKLLIAAGADVNMTCVDDGCTPLHKAAAIGHAGVVSALIETAGVVMNAALTDHGESVGATPLFIAAEDNQLDVVTLLIAAGADVNMARFDGCTPLGIAAVRDHAGVVSALIESAGVDLNAALTDGVLSGVTPLFLAAQSNRLDVVKLLIAAGADVNKACVDGDTPFQISARKGYAGVVLALTAGR